MAQDPCVTPHPATTHQVPVHIIGRIQPRGSHRIARRLHGTWGACPAGPPVLISAKMLKAALITAAALWLTAVPPLAISGATTAGTAVWQALPASPAGLIPGIPVRTGPADPVRIHHKRTPIPEPGSLSVLSAALAALLLLRRGPGPFRPA